MGIYYTENFLTKLVKDINLQISEAQKIPNRLNPKNSTPRHIINCWKVKTKKKILKATRDKQETEFERVQIFHQESSRPEVVKHHFENAESKEMFTQNSIAVKISFRNESKIEASPIKEH